MVLRLRRKDDSYLVDLPDLETAVEIAALLPREYVVEVRPTVEVQV